MLTQLTNSAGYIQGGKNDYASGVKQQVLFGSMSIRMLEWRVQMEKERWEGATIKDLMV